MPKTAIIILIRQMLMVGGSLLVGTSGLEPTDVETIAGTLATLIGVVWEVYERRHAIKPRKHS